MKIGGLKGIIAQGSTRKMEPIETEVKLRCESVDAFKKRLEEAGAALKLKRDRHFEDNLILDSASGTLRGRLAALRVRKTDDVATVTLKELPPANAGESKFKSRIELETRVGDGDVMLEIFARLGFLKSFRYQKYRTIYEASLPSGESLDVMFDETPIGVFAELEGVESDVARVLEAIGAKRDEHILQSYLTLQIEECARHGQPLSDMVF